MMVSLPLECTSGTLVVKSLRNDIPIVVCATPKIETTDYRNTPCLAKHVVHSMLL